MCTLFVSSFFSTDEERERSLRTGREVPKRTSKHARGSRRSRLARSRGGVGCVRVVVPHSAKNSATFSTNSFASLGSDKL